MFKKVLLAEDFQGENRGIVTTLHEKLGIDQLQGEMYCDKALNRLKVAHGHAQPFELLITDLSFKKDHVVQKVASGISLMKAAREIQPKINIIVNSMEDNPMKINALFKEHNINGYVCKGPNGLQELVTAIREVYQNRTYVSPNVNLQVQNNVFELEAFDLDILKDLANGLTKKEIALKLRDQHISPNSESTIDKRVSRLFDEFGAKNTNHLIAKLVKLGKI